MPKLPNQPTAGDPAVSRWFSEEVEPHESALRLHLRRKFPDHPDIDDLVQETYSRLLRARESGNVRAPKSFLFTTARNAAFDYFRRRRVVAIDGTPHLDHLPVFEDRPGVPETVSRDQELQMLAEGIQALPPRCRRVLTLRKISELSHAQIAAQLGISERTVNAQLAVGLLRLRDWLRNRGVTR